VGLLIAAFVGALVGVFNGFLQRLSSNPVYGDTGSWTHWSDNLRYMPSNPERILIPVLCGIFFGRINCP